jgi:hypothetical protein
MMLSFNQGGKMKAKADKRSMRRFLRVKPDFDEPVKVDINGDGFIEIVKAVDISEAGIRITVPHRFSGCHVDQPVSFIISLPPPVGKHVSLEGRIKHVRSDSFGVNFTNVDERARAMIRRYIGGWIRRRSLWDYLRYSLGLMR